VARLRNAGKGAGRQSQSYRGGPCKWPCGGMEVGTQRTRETKQMFPNTRECLPGVAVRGVPLQSEEKPLLSQTRRLRVPVFSFLSSQTPCPGCQETVLVV